MEHDTAWTKLKLVKLLNRLQDENGVSIVEMPFFLEVLSSKNLESIELAISQVESLLNDEEE